EIMHAEGQQAVPVGAAQQRDQRRIRLDELPLWSDPEEPYGRTVEQAVVTALRVGETGESPAQREGLGELGADRASEREPVRLREVTTLRGKEQHAEALAAGGKRHDYHRADLGASEEAQRRVLRHCRGRKRDTVTLGRDSG